MKDRFASALLASAIVIISIPGVVSAPEARAALELPRSAPRTEVKRFVARLPLAAVDAKPKKRVGANGRESLGVKTTAGKVVIIDEVSGTILYAHDALEHHSIASITKLMTARVLRAQGLDWDAPVTITTVNDGGGAAYFAVGDVVTVRALWHTMLIGSSNTAALALVAASGLTVPDFVNEMNANASGLGMAQTHFVDTTGLDAGNVSTAHEVALLTSAALADTEIGNTLVTPTLDLIKIAGKRRQVSSTNKLLGTFVSKPPYRILGGKTGYIVESGYNMALRVVKEDAGTVIVVVLGSASNDLRFQETKSLAYWAFQNYEWPARTMAALRR